MLTNVLIFLAYACMFYTMYDLGKKLGVWFDKKVDEHYKKELARIHKEYKDTLAEIDQDYKEQTAAWYKEYKKDWVDNPPNKEQK